MEVEQDIEELLIMRDSDLIILQAQGEWETRDVKLIHYKQHVEELGKRSTSIEFRYIPRCHNELADALATLASMLPYPSNAYIDPLEIQIKERHDYCNAVEVEPNVQPWSVWTPYERVCFGKENPPSRLLLDDHGRDCF
uniref:RNase H type-1 domain-containing protein n=1 Tax=Nicotiana tabacum TaxID=4097 RepID=A0A1S4BYB1_TOBAC